FIMFRWLYKSGRKLYHSVTVGETPATEQKKNKKTFILFRWLYKSGRKFYHNVAVGETPATEQKRFLITSVKYLYYFCGKKQTA
ncbi:MAG: hypothetical protein ABJC98_03580, partial [Bacteroidota bacterium]